MSSFDRLAKMSPEKRRYWLQSLPTHLADAGEAERLNWLLTNFEFLEAKIVALDPQQLIHDYEKCDGTSLRLVQDAIRLSAHILREDKTQLAGQLLGRLLSLDVPTIQALMEQVRCVRVGAWLRPLTASLTPAGGPLLCTLMGHTESITSVGVTADSQRAITASADCSLKVWDLPNAVELYTLHGHGGPVTAVAVTPDGQRAISASQDETLKFWDLERGVLLGTLFSGRVSAVAISPDGRRSLSCSGPDRLFPGHGATMLRAAIERPASGLGSVDSPLRMWDLEAGIELVTLRGHTAPVNVVAITPDGRKAISASEDRTLKVWDLVNGVEIHTLRGHTRGVTTLTLLPDGRRAISCAESPMPPLKISTNDFSSPDVLESWKEDRTLRVWDIDRGTEVRTLPLKGTGVIKGVTVGLGDFMVISTAGNASLRVWNPETGVEQVKLCGHAFGVSPVTVTPDLRYVVSASDRDLKIWDLERETQERLATLAHSGAVTAVAVTPDERRATSTAQDSTLKVWDLHSGVEMYVLDVLDENQVADIVGFAVTSDGRIAVSASGGGTLKVWDLEQGAHLKTLRGHSSPVTAVAVTPDGRRCISTSRDNTLQIWDLEVGILEGLGNPITDTIGVWVTPDGRRAITASGDGTLKVWDLERGAHLHTLRGHDGPVTGVAVTPDGRRAISTSRDNTLRVWDLHSGVEMDVLDEHPSLVDIENAATGSATVGGWRFFERYREAMGGLSEPRAAVVLALDGRRAVSARHCNLNVWDLESGIRTHTLRGHSGSVTSVAVTPDGRRAISVSTDETLKVWDLERAVAITTFRAESPLWACALGRDGISVVAGSKSGQVHIMRLEGAEAALEPNERQDPCSQQSRATRRLRPSGLFVPHQLGEVSEVHEVPHADVSTKLLILIQEAHVNYECQKHIAQILDRFASTYAIRLILVEGGEGYAGLRHLRELGSSSARAELAEEHLRSGMISGEEYLDIISEHPLLLWGVDDSRLHEEQMRMFLDLDRGRAAIEGNLVQLRQLIDQLMAQLANEALREFESKRALWDVEELGFAEYIDFLLTESQRLGVEVAACANIKRWVTTRQLEAQMKWKQVELEQRGAVTRLQSHAADEELAHLREIADRVKARELQASAFGQALELLIHRTHLELAEWPHLADYFHYLRLKTEVQLKPLLSEICEVQGKVKARLINSSSEAELVSAEERVALIERLVRQEWTPEDYRTFQRQPKGIRISQWLPALLQLGSRLGVASAGLRDTAVFEADLARAARSYEIARARGAELVRRSLAKMDMEGQQAAVLIAGGFHTDHLIELLGKESVHIAVVTPVFGPDQDQSRYARIVKAKYEDRRRKP